MPTPSTRAWVYRRDLSICRYCGKQVIDTRPANSIWQRTLDHVIPRAQGGTNRQHNLVTACWPCNMMKGDRTPEQAGMPLLTAGTLRIPLPSRFRPAIPLSR